MFAQLVRIPRLTPQHCRHTNKKLEDKEAKSTKTSLRDIESIKATKDPPNDKASLGYMVAVTHKKKREKEKLSILASIPRRSQSQEDLSGIQKDKNLKK